MENICVFCGSSNGISDSYISGARELGTLIVENGYGLVYGGANIGTMGAIADSILDAGGRVTGVIPKAISDMEVAHTGLTKLEVVDDMHQRKARMMALSDAFIAMPGGLGTLEEIFETLTWLQLGFHSKPCGLLNTGGFYQKLSEFLQHAEDQGFIKGVHRKNLLIADSGAELIELIRNWQLSSVSKL